MVTEQLPANDDDVVDAEFVPPIEYADDWAVAERLMAERLVTLTPLQID